MKRRLVEGDENTRVKLSMIKIEVERENRNG